MSPAKIPISVLILARNEANFIARAVKSVNFAAEVIVIDANSDDATPQIAKDLGAKVVSRPWTNFGEQRNFSLTQAMHPWVLVLDADEAATPALAEWLKLFFATEAPQKTIYRYKIKRLEYLLGKRIQGACWNPSYQDRFFRKDKAKYIGEIHEYPLVEGEMQHAPPEAAIEHNPRVTIDSFLDKMNRYTTIEAWDRYRSGQRTSLPHLAVVFFSTWWKNYFYYKAYRDGKYGFVIALLEAVSRTVRHLKLWQIQTMDEQGRLAELSAPNRASTHTRQWEAKENV